MLVFLDDMEDPNELRALPDVVLWTGVRIYREGLMAGLTVDPRIAHVMAVGDAVGCRAALARRPSSVLVLDIASDEALDVIRSLRDTETAVVALGVAEAEPEVLALAEAGVAAYVTREQPLDELVSAIVAVTQGEARCTPRIAGMIVRRLALLAEGRDRPTRAKEELTRREAEILVLMSAGLSNKEIAWRLSIELSTVKNHVHRILEKLGVSSRAQAVALTSGPAPRPLARV